MQSLHPSAALRSLPPTREIIFDIIREDDGGFCAAARGEGIFTQGDRWEELRYMFQDATEAYFFDEVELPAKFHLKLNLRGNVEDTVDFILAKNPLLTVH